jgi:glycosyltransferase involved in cell wall biosynthesis
MRLAYIAAGAAGMYCGSCIHDNTLARALIRKGVDVALVPTYTPIRTDEEDVSEERVFFGGINVYLQHKSALFRHTPWMLDRLLDRPGLLNSLGRLSGSTSAEDLGGLTVSMLEGADGPHAKELDKLLIWLRDFKPDLVQLTNSMFLGFAGPIREALGVPVVVAFQGEDIFLDALSEPYRTQAQSLMVEHAKRASGFIATCQYYSDFMSDYVDVEADRIDVVPLGIDLDGHGQNTRSVEDDTDFRIGYLARVCPEKGLHILAEAFKILYERNSQPKLSLNIAGWVGKRDEAYLAGVKGQLGAWGLSDRVTYLHDFSREEKVSFLSEIDVLSVPTPYREPKGLFALEAMANGVPIVQPNHGAYPDYIEKTGGGVLVSEPTPGEIADGIQKLIDDKALRRTMATRGAAGVKAYYTDDRMAEDTLKVYNRYLKVDSENA